MLYSGRTLIVLLTIIVVLMLAACNGKDSAGNIETGTSKATGQMPEGASSQLPNGQSLIISNGDSNEAKSMPPQELGRVMVLIPGGEFLMGSDEVDASGKSQEFGFNEPLYLPEHPQRKVTLDAFYIDKYEVTNAQFKQFLNSIGKYSKMQIDAIVKRLQMEKDNLPVRNITWFKADEYCKFAGKRLPTEAEWEKAARGTDAREYPWGNDWNPEYVNAGQAEADVMPVGSLDKGVSPFGAFEMAGNVMEWTANWFQAYPGAEYQSPNYGQKRRVARGGSWGGVGHYVIPHYFRVAYRFNFPPDQAFNDVGFRCAKDVAG